MGDANAETAYRAALGRLIARLREARGLTQGVVARRVGLSQPTFSRLELGGSGLTPWTLRQLAQIFAVSPGRLVHLVELTRRRHLRSLREQGLHQQVELLLQRGEKEPERGPQRAARQIGRAHV